MNHIPVVHDSEAWHGLRAKHVGGSEIAALFDLPTSDRPAYMLTRFALWHIKAGNAPPPVVDNPRAKWGLRLETTIAEIAAAERGWKIRSGGYAKDPTTPGLGCTLDFDIEEPGPLELELGFTGPGVMEVKNVDWMVHRRSWTDDEPPLHILLQLQHQLAATNYSWGVIPGFVGGNDLRYYPYAARPKLIAEIRHRVTDFWQSIAEGREPNPDGSDSASAVLRALYPETTDDAVDFSTSNEWAEAACDLFNAARDRREVNDRYEEAKNRVVHLLGPHRRGYGNGWSVNCSVTSPNPGRDPKPGELIGKRAEVRKYTAKEMTA